MSAHTPGEWKITAGLSEHCKSIHVGVGGIWVASVMGSHDKTLSCGCVEKVPGFPANEEAVANARLIAAAPDLLEALKFFMAGDLAVGHTAYDKARQAIKRATEATS